MYPYVPLCAAHRLCWQRQRRPKAAKGGARDIRRDRETRVGMAMASTVLFLLADCCVACCAACCVAPIVTTSLIDAIPSIFPHSDVHIRMSSFGCTMALADVWVFQLEFPVWVDCRWRRWSWWSCLGGRWRCLTVCLVCVFCGVRLVCDSFIFICGDRKITQP